MIHLLLTAALVAGGGGSTGSDSLRASLIPENWDFGYSTLFQANAAGSWTDKRPTMDSTCFDAEFSVYTISREVNLLATAVARSESSPEVGLRRARASVRWPGTPWLGGSVHFADRQPFIPGLRQPVAEWGWVNADSIMGFGLSGGGILGFQAFYLLQEVEGDTLEQVDVFSPWLGFAGLDYYRARLTSGDSLPGDEVTVNALAIRTDFRYASPWLVITGSDGRPGRWALSGDIRDFRPLETGWGRIEVVPGIRFAGDSVDLVTTAYTPGQRILFLGTYLESPRYMVSAGLEGMLDLESDSLSGISAAAGMISTGGVTWDMMLSVFADGDYSGSLASGISDSFASAGMMLEVIDDSTRLTGTASYSPRRDVCAEISVAGDLDDSLQPSCAVAVSAALGPVRGLLKVDWTYDSSPVFSLNLRGLLR